MTRLLPRKLLLIVSVVFVGFVALSFGRFWGDYYRFSKASLKGIEQLKVPAISTEIIVVLTGDRKRIPGALELLRYRGTPHLIISGIWKGTTLTQLVNSQSESAGNLQAIWEKIILESNSTSTIENAIESGKIIEAKKITRVILVTSDYHMSRSLALFKKIAQGPEYIPYPTPSDFTEFLNGKLEHAVEGISKFIVEYWKDFLYQFYLFKIL